MRKNLTTDLIRNSQPKSRDHFIWDQKEVGLGLKITPKGRKVFVYQYKDYEAISRRITLGKFGPLTLSQAQKRAKVLAGRIANEDSELFYNEIKRPTLKIEEAGMVFLDSYVRDLKPRTQTEYRRVFEKYLPNNLKRKKLLDLRRKHIKTLKKSMTKNPHGFNRTVKVMSKFYNWCFDNEYIAENYNPFKFQRKFKESSSERYLSSQEIKRLRTNLKEMRKLSSENIYALSAIEILLLTGARKMEILNLKWDEYCPRTRCLNLSDSKTGPKKIYIGEEASRLFKNLPRLESSSFIFQSSINGKKLNDLRSVWKRVCKNSNIENVRLHDLRHTFASVALSRGLSLDLIGGLLGHSDPRTTKRYAHLSNDALKKASEKTSNAITSEL